MKQNQMMCGSPTDMIHGIDTPLSPKSQYLPLPDFLWPPTPQQYVPLPDFLLTPKVLSMLLSDFLLAPKALSMLLPPQTPSLPPMGQPPLSPGIPILGML